MGVSNVTSVNLQQEIQAQLKAQELLAQLQAQQPNGVAADNANQPGSSASTGF